MKAVVVRRVMVGLSVIGLGVAIYLTYVHYAGIKPACTAGQSCIKVQSSVWSKLDGVPVALLGLIGYVGILLSLLVPDREESRLATLGMTGIGFAFSAYLTYRELFSIHAVCEWCASSAVILTILFLCSVYRYLTVPAVAGGPGPTGPPAGPPETARGAAPTPRKRTPAAPPAKGPGAGKKPAGPQPAAKGKKAAAASAAKGKKPTAEPAGKAATSATLGPDGE